MKVAIIGSGPSGFFVAGEVLKRCPGCDVHMFEKRVAPYGLARYGVAPDHQLTRRTIKLFDQIADQARFHFHGNIEVGKDVSLQEIHASHHAVVLCTGAEQPNRPDIPGATLSGAIDALDFSRWTNSEPVAFMEALLDDVDTAVIIGNGNVALDAARMLARPSADWVTTDIAPYAMEALTHHRIKHIVIAGRRGPSDVSFTEAELIEVANLPGWDVKSEGVMPFSPLPEKPASDRIIEFNFNLTPACLLGDSNVVGARFSRTPNGETVEVGAQLVIFATGHRGIKIGDLPFDQERGVIPSFKGRVNSHPGYYVCGWIKRGAKGLIGQNRKDAIETVTSMIEDRDALSIRPVDDVDWTEALKGKGVKSVTWSEWKKIDTMEILRGSAVGRPRINFTGEESLRLL